MPWQIFFQQVEELPQVLDGLGLRIRLWLQSAASLFVNASSHDMVRITRQHVESALEKRRRKRISERRLGDWATMIVTNHVFYWDREEAEFVAEWVNSLCLDL